MKTPREILFKKHEGAEAKLDAIRNEVVAERGRSQSQEAANIPANDQGGCLRFLLRCCARGRAHSVAVLTKLWQELVWPCRRIWAGMAAVWVVVAFLGFASAEKESVVAENTTAPTADVILVLKEQRQMMAQLLDSAPVPMDRPRAPGPRSEVREVVMVV